MGRFPKILTAAVLSGLLSAGCAEAPQPRDDGPAQPAAESFLGRQVARGMAEAQRKLETENIRLDGRSRIHVGGHSFGGSRHGSDLPRAEITPQGVLLVAGEEVPATSEQQALLLDYRRHLVGLAQAGMAVGAHGADIAGTALAGLGKAVFGGAEGRQAYEQRIEAEGEKIKQEALKLCALLPGLYESQQALAAAMPGFAPYATMTREDVDECHDRAVHDAGTGLDAGTAPRLSSHRHGAMR